MDAHTARSELGDTWRMQWFQSPEQHIPPIIESLTQKVVEQHTNQRFATTPQPPDPETDHG